jgi:hypothetical protein
MRVFFFILVLFSKSLHAQKFYYVAPSLGIVRYTGEVEFNQFFFWSPIAWTSRPVFGLLGGVDLQKRWRVEINTDLVFYAGDNRYSNPTSSISSDARLNGFSLLMGGASHKRFENNIDVGIGLNVGWNRFNLINGNYETLTNSYNLGILAILTKRIYRYRGKNEVLMRYTVSYNASDNWDSYDFGILGDIRTDLKIIYLIRARNIKSMDMGGRRGIRSRTKCPTF